MGEHEPEREPVDGMTDHLETQTLAQLAEGTLQSAEAVEARVHLDRCARCSTELEAFTSLFGSLGELPRFAPSPAFADAVMARVRIAPQESPALAWLRRLAPTSRRGWILLAVASVAPALPIFALVIWLLTQPLLTPATLWQWTLLRAQAASQTSAAWLFDRAINSGLLGWAEGSLAAVRTFPVEALGGIVAILAVAIPLSVWGIVRLTRAPSASVTYAN